jgi:hypothetical protein
VSGETDITEILGLRNNTILAGDLNAKRPVWNSNISNLSFLKLSGLFDRSDLTISATQCPTPSSPDGRGGVLNILVHQNVRLSEATVTEVLDSDYLPVKFSFADHVRARDVLYPAEKFTDWEQFQSLPSQIVSPKIQVHSSEEAD